MIVFITPVHNPDIVKDYSYVESLLYNTLSSVCNQEDEDFKVIVVCYEEPGFNNELFNKHVEYLVVDIQSPIISDDKWVSMESLRIHKGLKILNGILFAQKYNPNYIILIDSDDYISSKISGFLNSIGSESTGWYVDKGYILCHSTKQFWRVNDFHKFCGTSIIFKNSQLLSHIHRKNWNITINVKLTVEINTEKTNFINTVLLGDPEDKILEVVDLNYIKYILGSHRFTSEYYNLKPLPFPGAIWNWNTGENFVKDRKMKKKFNGIPDDLNSINWNDFFLNGYPFD